MRRGIGQAWARRAVGRMRSMAGKTAALPMAETICPYLLM
jgi:hypothetical protein